MTSPPRNATTGSGSKLAWIERGSHFARRPGAWLRIGPLVLEFHSQSWAFGLVFGAWYIGANLGPCVVTVGQRRWLTTEETGPAWSTASYTITCDTGTVDA